MIAVKDLIQVFKTALAEKWGYIWGKSHEMWTAEKQAKYFAAYATDVDRGNSARNGGKWIGHWVTDCSGLFSYAFSSLGGKMYHGSHTMFNSWCTNKGALKSGKREDGRELKPGTAVFCYNSSTKRYSHVGLYIGDGEVIEAAGASQGVIKSKVTNTKWKYWGELKGVNYEEAGKETGTHEIPTETTQEPVTVTYPTIREGARGEIVTQLQDLLAKAGSSLQIDGIFGRGTRSAVQAFQRKYGLEVDGIVGPKTWKKLLEVAGNIQVSESTHEKTVTLRIPDLTEKEAAALMQKYPKAQIV